MRRALPLLVLAALAAALAVPHAASAAPDQVVITGDVNVARGETVGDVVSSTAGSMPPAASMVTSWP
jgi:uncharacterized lipoprotein YbaY